MRIQALTLLILATLVSTATANDEIKRLLADLSFGDAMTSDAANPLPEPAKPVPQLAAPPVMEKVAIEKTPPVSHFDAFPAFSELVEAGPGLQLPPESAPKAVLKEPVADVTPLTDINLSEVAVASPPKVALVQPIETKSVGHRHHSSTCEPRGYETGIVCRPRVSPTLPTSTFLQYFRGNPCYSNVWDGYRYDCGSHHAHINGECDCFKGKNSGCNNCDSRSRH
ncbi:MAG: hypothetical protein ACR2OA_06990 [Rubripirellula sp.]